MQSYNYSALCGLMREKKITQDVLASRIGINSSTLSGKLNNRSEFTQGEMIAIMRELGKGIKDVPHYFFQH